MPDARERVTYISSHAKQENLYAVYEMTDCHYWTELARCNQQEFQKSGTEGKCTEAREFIIVLLESFPDLYEPEKLLQLFTDRFKEKLVWNAYRRCTITNERQTTICRHSGKEHSDDQKVYPESAQKGILIYRTLLETESIQQTAVKTKEPADKVKKIAEQYQVEVLE